MKYLFIGAVFFLFAGACSTGGSDNKSEEDDTVVNMDVDVSPQMAEQMNSFLEAYYQLTDALVQDDSDAAVTAAGILSDKTNDISLENLSDADRREEAAGRLEKLKSEVGDLQNETSLDDLRSSFEEVSEDAYHLIKTVGLRDVTVYRTYCPMAFDDEGAYWLSHSSDILNPYFGHKMINCGEVKETLVF